MIICRRVLLPAALPLMVSLSTGSTGQKTIQEQFQHVANFDSLFGVLPGFLWRCHCCILYRALLCDLLFQHRAWPIFQLPLVSKVCGCLVATYIGGSANLAEVAWETGLAKDAQGFLGCLAAADVLLMCFYFAGLMLAAKFSRVGRYGVTGFDNTFAKMETTEEDMTLGMVCCCFFWPELRGR